MKKTTTKKTAPKKRMADGLMQGLQQAVLMRQGKLEGRRTVRVLARPAPKWTSSAIKKLRAEYNMSQPEFAALLNVKVATIRSWEQGNRIPNGTSARLLEFCADDIERVKQRYNLVS